MKYFNNILKLDLRALALMRIAISFVILLDLFIRSSDMEAFYSDAGVMPSQLVIHFYDLPHVISLHLLNGSVAYQYILFGVSALFAYCLMIGYQTRLFTFLSWVMLVSLHNRNPIILQGGDDLLRLTLFWAIFLPWGKRLSIDQRIYNTQNQSNEYSSLFGLAFILQVCYVYGISAFQKGPEWDHDFSALYYIYHLDQINYGIANQLAPHETLLKALTAVAYYFELLVPLFILSPFKTNLFRVIGVIAIMVFHLWNGITIQVGLFFIIGIVSTIGLLPSNAIDFIQLRFNKHHHLINRFLFHTYNTFEKARLCFNFQLPHNLYNQLKESASYLAIFLIIYVFALNYSNIPAAPYVLNDQSKIPANFFRLDQNWGMFAPAVFKDDGWYIYQGITENGDTIDIKQKGTTINYNKPDKVVAAFKNDRWRKYGEQYMLPINAFIKPYLCSYLSNKWNKENPTKKIRQLHILYMLEYTMPDYKTGSPVKKILYSCY